MRGILRYICLTLFALVSFSCAREFEPQTPAMSASAIQVVGRAKSFNSKVVGTKALKTEEESKISNMMLYIFDSAGNLVDRQSAEGSAPLFTIDRNKFSGHNQSLMTSASVYVMANIPAGELSLFEAVTSLNDLLGIDMAAQMDIPSIGFPMLGHSSALDLSTGSSLSGTVIEIPLVCLYAKIALSFSVNPTQSVDEVIQKFEMEKWTVYNVPDKVRVGAPASDAETANAGGTVLPEVSFSSYAGSNPVQQNGSALTFSFYMPEHKINPEYSSSNYPDYPWGSKTGFDEYRQHYKPILLGQGRQATYVKVEGKYFDHKNRAKAVTYYIYLGENNYDNFHINRNCQLNNYVTIKGATKSSTVPSTGGDDVSVDHRVDLEQGEFKFELERETMLDSHWEIRPIRITFDPAQYPNAKMTVTIKDPDSHTWIRMEEKSTATQEDGTYCAGGKRKYFTNDLLSTLGDDGKEIVISASDGAEHCIWVYVDENLGSSADGYRDAIIEVQYNVDDTKFSEYTDSFNCLFRQKDLYPISYSGRTYNIEYFEEYLYNFDSKDKYTTTDGMAWGLDGVQLSSETTAIFVTGTSYDSEILKVIKNNFDPKYDFYIKSGEVTGVSTGYFNEYAGLYFTKKIVSKSGIEEKPRPTDQMPESAVEYCYNKNKRKSDGTIDSDNIHWYLPAIDEIEDICMGGFSVFDVFQNNFYWSSQPSYTVSDWTYKSTFIGFKVNNVSGSFYQDNTSRARATKFSNTSGTFTPVDSGETNAEYVYAFTREVLGSSSYKKNKTGNTPVLGPGNQPRSTINRIRCVYKP